MSILDNLLGVIAPHECLGCGYEGELLCHKCLNTLPITQFPLPAKSNLRRIRSVTKYEGVAKDLIWKLKSDGAQAAAKTMGSLMSKFCKSAGLIIVPVPTATSRVRQRGYDQAVLIARSLASQTGLIYQNCLVRSGQAHQVGSTRQERLGQLRSAFRVKKRANVVGSKVLLVDDVTTTGATLETAAEILINAGAQSVEALTFAYAAIN